MREELAAITSRREAGSDLFVLELSARMADDIVAGHFVNVKVAQVEPFLRRPFSVAWRREGALELLIQLRGRGTAILAGLRPGDTLSLLGPLGTPFDLDLLARAPGIDLVAGGVGAAPLVLLAAQLRERAPTLPIRLFLGARTRALLPEPEVTAARVPDTVFATDDGTAGHHGTVVGLYAAHASADRIVCGCGPSAMLEALRVLAMERALRCYLSLESAMACGFGVCQGCVVRTAAGAYAKVCDDGPVFDARALAPLR